jgi:polyisoprenoid-binding protein YceI
MSNQANSRADRFVRMCAGVRPKGDTMNQQATDTTSASTVVPTGVWTVDPDHSRVGFAIRHMAIATVRGEFTTFEGTLEVGDGQSSARGTVSVASILTNQPQRDEHLRSPDFFDAAQYPTITFSSTEIEPNDDGSIRIIGDLTIHGVTDQVVLRAVVGGTDVDPFGNERVGLEVTGDISRGVYDMGFNQPLKSGAMFVGDKVQLTLDISAIKAT